MREDYFPKVILKICVQKNFISKPVLSYRSQHGEYEHVEIFDTEVSEIHIQILKFTERKTICSFCESYAANSHSEKFYAKLVLSYRSQHGEQEYVEISYTEVPETQIQILKLSESKTISLFPESYTENLRSKKICIKIDAVVQILAG